MLENAIYSVISPEGCATILWRDPKKTLEAAKAMKLSAKDLLELKVIDEIINEPNGGAHRDRDKILENIKTSIKNNLSEFMSFTRDEVFIHRKNKFLSIGRNKGFSVKADDDQTLVMKENNFQIFKNKFINLRYLVLSIVFVLLSISLIYLL
jgi:acetyl-CoA carboxylase carboxyl transferase subunit alpha